MSGNLWVSVLGVVLASGSLAWQAATYALTGGRVKVQLEIGATNGRVLVTGLPSGLRGEWQRDLAEQGYSVPVVAVRVANVGRLPVTVRKWSLAGPQLSFVPMASSIGKPLPHRLEVGESETWAIDAAEAQPLIEFTRKKLAEKPKLEPLTAPPRNGIWAEVELGDGRTKRSRNLLRLR